MSYFFMNVFYSSKRERQAPEGGGVHLFFVVAQRLRGTVGLLYVPAAALETFLLQQLVTRVGSSARAS